MKLSEVLPKLGPVIGVTSFIGAPRSVGGEQTDETITLKQAEKEFAAVKKAQQNCRSDAAWWGYEGQIAFWECIVSLMRAVEITGPDNLPDVPLPDLQGGVVMDLCGRLTDFGRKVLTEAEKTKAE